MIRTVFACVFMAFVFAGHQSAFAQQAYPGRATSGSPATVTITPSPRPGVNPPATPNQITVYPASPAPQQNFVHTPLTHTTACIRYAVEKDKEDPRGLTVEAIGQYIVFRCYGKVAQDFMGSLGKKTPYPHEDQYGQYQQINLNDERNVDSHRCWQRQRTSEGQFVMEYGCNIYLKIGPYLKE